eukprot:6570363-Pyramimonas_sp.AAC.1
MHYLDGCFVNLSYYNPTAGRLHYLQTSIPTSIMIPGMNTIKKIFRVSQFRGKVAIRQNDMRRFRLREQPV